MEKASEADEGFRKKPIYWFEYLVSFSGNLSFKVLQMEFKKKIVFVASMMLLAAAVAFGWPSPSIPKLRQEDSPIPSVTSDQGSWIVALLKVGSILASLIAIWLMNM